MISSLKAKLMVTYIFLILISMLVVGGYLLRALERSAIEGLDSKLEAQARLAVRISRNVIIEGILSDYSVELADQLGDEAEARVTFINSIGLVLGDSQGNPYEMENHAQRPEVLTAFRGEIGSASRYSTSVDEEMLYVAYPVMLSGGETAGVVRLALPLTQIRAQVQNQWSLLFSAIVLSMLIAGVISFRFAHKLSVPMMQIRDTARQIAKGKIQERVKIYSHDEIGQLGQALNEMATTLGEKIAEAEATNIKLQTVVENMPGAVFLLDNQRNVILANKASEELLRIEKEAILGENLENMLRNLVVSQQIDEVFEKGEGKLQGEITFYYPTRKIMEVVGAPVYSNKGKVEGLVLALHDITEMRLTDKVRRDFVANISHELRTPVTAVKGYSETLLDGVLEDKEIAREFVEIIYRESGRLSRLIAELLELSRLENRQEVFHYKRVDLNKIITMSIENIAKKATLKNLEINLNSLNEELILKADSDRLQQVLNNLLENAIKYSPEGSTINISYESFQDKDEVTVRVSDRGPGIPKEDINRIFERFYRVEKGRSRKEGGTGLGLSIVKHIVETHGGKVWAENGMDGGARFCFTLKTNK